MILTVTLNPLLERRLSYKKVTPGGNHRRGKEYFTPGGKGINVSRQLHRLGVKSLAVTLLGGSRGKMLRKLLKEEKLDFTAHQIRAESREASLIIDEKKNEVTTYFGPDFEITEKEADEFSDKLAKMIENCEIVVLSGSSPGAAADSIFPYAIKTALRNDKIAVLDTYGDHLEECIKAGPVIFHSNVNEVESSLDVSLRTKADKNDFLKYLYSHDIKQAYLTDGAKPFYAANFDFHYYVTPPSVKEIYSAGSGDAFTSLIVHGLYKDLVFEDYVKSAAAAGAANAASFDVCNVDRDTIEKLKCEVKINYDGKKINTVGV